MNVPEIILECLRMNGTAPVPGFGVFGLENTKAAISADKNSILPPAKQIVFSADYQLVNLKLAQFYSSKTDNPSADVETALKNQVDYWKKMISEGKEFEVLPLGKFKINDGNLQFHGERIQTENPDFYGLEEIKLSDIRKKNHSKEYKLNRTILWTVILLGVAAFGATAFFGRNTLFGKKSFPEKPVGIKRNSLKTDSIGKAKKVSDSLKKDSLLQDSARKTVPVPAKKWNGAKKYSKKNKWKQKKRQNR